jgi:hypothetical protein
MSVVAIYFVCFFIQFVIFLVRFVDYISTHADLEDFEFKREVTEIVFAPIIIGRFLFNGLFYSITLDKSWLE